ncbi:ABC transporter permease subunit [Vulcanisaeta thermophila]|uniref:ABC transporter permease subunit n=1 Tax=Vulcanisaeta thermophila TaxID=867917 RepID=UPI000852E3BB|nr:ABC transporter permease subunit [Vulcanisaeta thermophila]
MTPWPVLLTAFLATLATLGRVALTIVLGIVTGWFLGYAAAKNGFFERIFLSITQTLEAVPVITFFPVVLIFFISNIRGYLGVEFAVDFLVFTAVVWNIWIGEYESIKTVSQSLEDATRMMNLGFLRSMRYLYIPATWPRVAGNVLVSFADGLFYIVVSEVITLGTRNYFVFGIGASIARWVTGNEWGYAVTGLVVLIVMVTVVIFGILRPFVNWAVKYSYDPMMEITKVRVRRPVASSRVRSFMARNIKYVRRIAAMEEAIMPVFIRASSYAIRHRLTVRSRFRNPLSLHEKYLGIALLILIITLLAYSVYSSWSATWSPIILDLEAHGMIYLYYLGLDWLRVVLVTVASIATAIPINYLMVTNRRVETVLLPILEDLASIPVSGYMPLIAIPFTTYLANTLGLGASLNLLTFIVAYLSTAWYVIYNMYVGMKTIPRSLWEVANNLNLSTWDKLRRLAIPGSMPATITGLASTVGSTWGGLEVAEYFQGINGHVYSVQGFTALMDYYTSIGNIVGLEAMSLILAINVILLSIFLWRWLFHLARERYRMEGAITL